nr:unnamed protein product [Digitaria exilis]
MLQGRRPITHASAFPIPGQSISDSPSWALTSAPGYLSPTVLDPATGCSHGGGSWGVVYSWKLRLVPVPENITVLAVDRRGSADEIAELIYKWQFVGPHLPDEFYLSTRIFFSAKTTTNAGGGNLTMSFTGQFLAPKHHVLFVLNNSYPELRITSPELEEMSWLEAAAKFAELNSVADLTSRFPGVGEYAKRKSDYVQAPISVPYNAVSHAAEWGQRYFGNNYDRLVRAKSKIDPGNVFNNAQSIPPLH